LSSFLAAGAFSRRREGVRGWVKTETRNKQNIGVTPDIKRLFLPQKHKTHGKHNIFR
jgi:hypothetical protein